MLTDGRTPISHPGTSRCDKNQRKKNYLYKKITLPVLTDRKDSFLVISMRMYSSFLQNKARDIFPRPSSIRICFPSSTLQSLMVLSSPPRKIPLYGLYNELKEVDFYCKYLCFKCRIHNMYLDTQAQANGNKTRLSFCRSEKKI